MRVNTKSVLSMLILLAFAIIGGGSIEDDGTLLVFLIVAVVSVIVAVVIGIVNGNQKEKEDELNKEKQRQAALKEKERLCQEYEIRKNEFVEKHGAPDSTIFWKDYDINAEINVYESTKIVFIMGKEYAFKDILSCTFNDNPTTVKGKVTAISKSNTDNGNAIGRAIVGGAIAGSTGAIIGGTTANRHTQTEYRQENDTTYHDYTVIINVNSISNPIIRIHVGENGRLVNDIVGLMNVIISRK